MNRILAVAALLLLSPFAIAGTPRVDARQQHQQARIEHGIEHGSLSPREQARLQAQQGRIARREVRAKSDGHVSRAERVHLKRSQNRASRNIRRQKRDC